MNIREWTRIPYTLYFMLQLAVEDALNCHKFYVLGQIQETFSHFHHSDQSAYLLWQSQVNLHQEQLCLIRDVHTRQNFSYYMAGYFNIVTSNWANAAQKDVLMIQYYQHSLFREVAEMELAVINFLVLLFVLLVAQSVYFSQNYHYSSF